MIPLENKSGEAETVSAIRKGQSKMNTNMIPLKRNTLIHMTVTGIKGRHILDTPTKMANTKPTAIKILFITSFV